MQIYSYIIDFIIVVIAFFTVIDAFKKGFLRSVVLLVGYFVAAIVTVKLSGYLATYIYDRFIYQNIVDNINSAVVAGLANMNIDEVVLASLSALPTFLSSLLKVNFGGVEGIKINLEQTKTTIEQNAGSTITDTIITQTIVPLLEVIFCILIFVILCGVVKAIASIFKNFYEIPILGPINSLLGGIMGIAQAIIMILILAVISNIVISMTDNNLSFYNNSILQNTFIFKWFFGSKFI